MLLRKRAVAFQSLMRFLYCWFAVTGKCSVPIMRNSTTSAMA